MAPRVAEGRGRSAALNFRTGASGVSDGLPCSGAGIEVADDGIAAVAMVRPAAAMRVPVF